MWLSGGCHLFVVMGKIIAKVDRDVSKNYFGGSCREMAMRATVWLWVECSSAVWKPPKPPVTQVCFAVYSPVIHLGLQVLQTVLSKWTATYPPMSGSLFDREKPISSSNCVSQVLRSQGFSLKISNPVPAKHSHQLLSCCPFFFF